jgi:predicted alpha/beta-hydrolase family hydrolase
MAAWAERLSTLGEVTRLDYPYLAEGRRRPDPLPALIEAHRAALARLRAAGPGPIVLAGKSMGSRVGCHLALEEEVAALVCFGYPLRGASGALRDEVLRRLRTPILFLQGTRDRLAPLDELAAVRARMAAPSTLHVVDGGDHSLEVGVRALRARGQTQADVDGAILEAVGRFLGAGVP